MRALIITLVPLVSFGCAHVRTTERIDEHTLDSSVEHTVSDDWTYAATTTVGDEVPVVAEVLVTRSHRCEDITRSVVHRTRIIDRTPERPGWTWAFAIAGAVGAGGLGTAFALDATGDAPFTTHPLHFPGMPMYGTVTQFEPDFYLALMSGALVPFIFVAIEEGARSTGGTEDLGDQERTTSVPSSCDTEPASSVRVRITSGDTVLGDAVTDDAGIAHVTIANAPTAEGEMHLLVEAQSVAGIEPIRARLIAVREAREQAEAAADLARRRAERAALLDREVAEGRCSDETHAELEAIFQHATTYAHLLSSGSSAEYWDLVTHAYEVVGPSGDDFTVRPGLRGEHHLFVVGLAPPQVVLRDADGYTVSEASAYAGTLATSDGHTVSRVIRSATGERLTARIVGRGCMLIMLFTRIN